MPAFVAMAATPEEIPHIARLQYEANATDPVFASIHPKGPSNLALAHLTRQLEDLMEDDPTVHVMVVKEAMRGDIVSYALWHFVSPRSTESVEEEMIADVAATAFPADSNVTLGAALVKNSIRKRDEIVSECFGMGRPYGYLAVIGTSPEFQKQGAASKLIEWATQRADDRDIPLYVESTPMALALYRNFGFQEYDHLRLDLQPIREGDFSHTCMIRFPNAA